VCRVLIIQPVSVLVVSHCRLILVLVTHVECRAREGGDECRLRLGNLADVVTLNGPTRATNGTRALGCLVINVSIRMLDALFHHECELVHRID